MRRCYAHVPAAENPLRPKAPKSPWSRRILFPAPSGHFRIVLFLIGLIGCLCLFSPRLVVPSIGSFSFSIRLPFPMVSFFGFHWGLMRPVCFFLSFAFRWFLGCLRFSSSVFPLGVSCRSFVRPQVSFIDLLVSFSWLCFPSSFPVLHSFSLFRFSLRLRFPLPVLFPRAACVFLSVSWISIAVRPFRLRSPIPPLRITSSQCAIGRRRRAYRPRLSASSWTASSRVAWRRWSR